ncbi:MAG: hypothetical protein IKO68_12090 [Oscillospiraceae bacterium]|nr:hypothetical protein [Oscillospiraceae bacterium]
MVVNKSLRTDLAREIRRSLPRFLSILLMVALGVMFLVGLRSAAPDMRITADDYFDRRQMFDLQLFSTLGLTDGDLEALRGLEGVEAAAGGRVLDGTLTLGNVQKVVKLHSLTPGFATPILKEGRLPERAGECALDPRLTGSVPARPGSRIQLAIPGDQGLVCEEFTVVGLAESPLYISIDRGTSTLGDGSVAGFVLLTADSFDMDAWTVAYLRAEGAAALDAYGPEYEALTDALRARAEPLLKTRAAERYDFLREDGARQLQEGREALETGQAEARARLVEAEARLAEGRAKLDAGWAELEQGKADYETGLREGREALDAAKARLEQGRQELASAAVRLSAARGGLAMLRQMAAENNANARQNTRQAEQRLSQKQAAIPALEERAAAAHREAEDYEEAWRKNAAAALLPGQEPDPDYTLEGLASLLFRASLEDALLDAARRDLDQAKTAYAEAKAAQSRSERENAAKLADAQAQLAAGEAAYQAGQAQLEAGREALRQGEADYETQSAEGARALEEGEAELRRREAEYAEGLEALETGRQEAETALAEGRDKLDRAARQLRELRPAESYVLDRHSNYGFVSYDQNAERMAKLAAMFPLIFYLVSALVCLTTMTRMVEEERTQIGAVKSLGYGTGAIAAKYLLYGALAAAIGALLGTIVGTTLIPWVIFSSYAIMYNLPKLCLRVHWGLCLGAAGAGLALTLGATAWAMGATARQTPAALLRPKAPKPGKRILLERFGPLWRRLSFSMKVSARNLFRYKKRLFMTVIGVAGCTALLIAGLGLHSSIFDILDVQFFELYRYDVQLSLDPASQGAAERVEALLARRPELDGWTSLYSRSVRFSAGNESVEGYVSVTDDPEGLARQILLRDMDSKAPVQLPESGALIDLKLAELLKLSPGDSLDVDIGRPVSLRVEAVREHYVYHYALMTRESYAAATGERPADNEYLISLAEPDEALASALCRDLMRIEGVQNVTNKTAMAGSFRKTLEVVNAAVMIIVLSAAALAFVVLYNLTNINVTERIRELATIKVLGFYDPELAMYIYRENLVLTVLGVLLGQPAGKLLCGFLIRTIEMDIVMFGRDPKTENYLLSVLLSFCFAALVNLMMYFRLKKIDMVQALKSVE